MRECLTPGCMYALTVGPQGVAVAVTFPADIDLTEAEAVALEERLHDAVEGALAPHFAQEVPVV